MKTTATMLIVCSALIAAAAAGTEPGPDEQVKGLEQMCEENAAARTARHAEQSLYTRLHEDEGIHRLTREIVRLHLENEQIKHMFAGLDNDLVARRVAEFMISGMGGPPVYQDRPTLPDSHRRLELTNADFLSAGADVIQAMKNLDYGQDEIDEVVCALVGLRSMVVLAEADTGAGGH